MLSLMFPGQGSQAKGMGGQLFEKYKEITESAADVLGYSIVDLCLRNPDRRLNRTQYTQPAIFVISAIMYEEEKRKLKTNVDYMAGHSLGEYTALWASGCYNFETGLKIIQKRSELMSNVKGGAMSAVTGLEEGRIQQIISENPSLKLYIANDNSPEQIVIAGIKEDIVTAEKIFKKAGASSYYMLNVSGPFHTPLMKSVKEEFASYLNTIEFMPMKVPVISNLKAIPYEPDSIHQSLLDQLDSKVQWHPTIKYLLKYENMEFREIGPGKILTELLKKIKNARCVENRTQNRSKTQNQDEKKDNFEFFKVSEHTLGSKEFKDTYKSKYAYVAGGMYKGIASKELVLRMAKAGMIGFLGTGGMPLDWIDENINQIKSSLTNGETFGVNVISGHLEEELIELCLTKNIRLIEAAAFIRLSPYLVKYRLAGLYKENGRIGIDNKIMAKVSRPEVAELFLSPAPVNVVKKLLENGHISETQASLGNHIPMCDDLCVEADSAGHTDQGNMTALLPAMMQLKKKIKEKYKYDIDVRIGAAGGIGTPEAAAAAFILGADFILTGSINQCTVEAGTSDAVKDLLQEMNVQDTDYAPAGDMFELGAKVQVLKRGVFFPARANKLLQLYQQHNSIEDIDRKQLNVLEKKYFRKSIDEVYKDCQKFYAKDVIEKAEKNSKFKMALIFKWYFGNSTRLALEGNPENQVDFQIQSGPALGSFNQWMKGTELENWRNRHVDDISIRILNGAGELLNRKFRELSS
jgi:trans-AT polyketide synthase, acyltransferase and oxidoreductase domains